MKEKGYSEQIKFIFLLMLFGFSSSCSYNLARQEINSAVPENTPDVCEKYVGEWFSNEFPNIEDESKIICGTKPCLSHNIGGAGFRLTCTDGKIKGEVILASSTPHSDANQAIIKNKNPQPIQEITTPLKEGRVEKDSLFLSFIDSRGCLAEINVSPKGEFLLGKFENKDCKKSGVIQEIFNKRGIDMKVDADKGGILLINKNSKIAF